MKAIFFQFFHVEMYAVARSKGPSGQLVHQAECGGGHPIPFGFLYFLSFGGAVREEHGFLNNRHPLNL